RVLLSGERPSREATATGSPPLRQTGHPTTVRYEKAHDSAGPPTAAAASGSPAAACVLRLSPPAAAVHTRAPIATSMQPQTGHTPPSGQKTGRWKVQATADAAGSRSGSSGSAH